MTQTGGVIEAHGPAWRDWVRTNVAAGCDPAEMAARMVEGGWTASAAAAALAEARGERPDEAPGDEGQGDRATIALPQLPSPGPWIFEGHRVAVTLRLAVPPVALCEGVLSAAECAELVAYAEARGMAASTVVDGESGAAVPHPERTSSGVMLRRAETPLIAAIERRLAALTDWPVANGEGLQVLRYQPGQEYRPHFDAFPAGPAGDLHRANGGQRVNTVLVYLRSPERGGETTLPNLGLTIRPEPGSVLMFHNVDGRGERLAASLHAGAPVEAGEKIVLTYWQREKAVG